MRLSALGDVIHALPAVEALRRARPDARIDWLVEDRHAALLEGHPALDRVVAVPRAQWKGRLRRPWRWPSLAWSFVQFFSHLVRARYDVAIDLQGNLKSGLSSLFSGAPLRYGFRTNDVREGNGFLTNRHVRVASTAVHRVDRALGLMAAVIGTAGTLCSGEATLAISRSDDVWVAEALKQSGLPERGFAVLHPGTSGFGSFKRWPADKFGSLARRLEAQGRRVVVTVGPGEESLGAEVRAASGERAVVLAPRGLPALAAILARAGVFVSGDTGPLHIATASGTPVVALFGPKDAAIYGPYVAPGADARAAVVTRDDVPCRPCTLRRCPDPVCMTSIEVDTVARRVAETLAAAAAR